VTATARTGAGAASRRGRAPDILFVIDNQQEARAVARPIPCAYRCAVLDSNSPPRWYRLSDPWDDECDAGDPSLLRSRRRVVLVGLQAELAASGVLSAPGLILPSRPLSGGSAGITRVSRQSTAPKRITRREAAAAANFEGPPFPEMTGFFTRGVYVIGRGNAVLSRLREKPSPG